MVKHIVWIGLWVLVGTVFSGKLRSLPGVSSLPQM